ncbi:transglycosylase domain-containing protein [Actinomadura rubrisoli]|uniref:transglycosylase domain-containing protein n=1 Tax=Actinomadura rubrisoli TaxID=2530368 RepID=UPI001FB7F7FE|nr:transglycosylase domain-containing protein [Actinomadura rubrisoli]
MLAVFTVGLLGLATLVVVAYMNTPIPSAAQQDAVKQESVFSYSDGSPLARMGMHRESLPLSKIPKHVQDAVLAAEDRNFWHEPGISPTGVTRALFKTATGGDVQGGSTITQQLARNYWQGLSQDRSISRKLKEILISVRAGEEMDKKEILGLYLNTVYFGRASYGIQAASRAYFHKPVNQINESQAAVLAAMIQRPNYFRSYGPDSNPAKKALIFRWNYVLDGMAKEGWLDPTKRAAAKFPRTYKEWSDIKGGPQAGYLQERVMSELETLGVDRQMVDSGGLRIKTTFNKQLQDYTGTVVSQIKKQYNLGKDIRFGLTAIDPKTGGVVAAYGGTNYETQQFDDSFQGNVQPGSSFKPIVLATALDQGVSLQTPMDGSYRRVIAGTPFTNDSRGENGVYTLKEMTAQSINTAYVDLGQKVGLDKVADMAVKMGIPERTPNLKNNYTSLPLGVIDTTSVTMASVYSTFAAEGQHRPAHVIAEITDKDGKPIKNNKGKLIKKRPFEKSERVFSEGVARDATSAMRAVVTTGTGKRANLGARPVAGKTGTTDQNKSAWFVGYTPELSTSVAMWRQKGENRQSLIGVGGYNQVYGGTVPADLFKQFMLKALEGKEITPFGAPVNGGQIAPWAVAKPTPKPSTSPTPKNTPTCTPDGGQQNGGQRNGARPCVSSSPDPSTPPTSQPPSKVPCNQFNMPPGCDPDIPPPGFPDWWCQRGHMDNPGCKEEEPRPPNGR